MGGVVRAIGVWFGRDRDTAGSATPELEGGLPHEVGDGLPGVGRIPAGIRYMALGAFFFSLMSLLVKVAGQRLPSQQVVLVRAVITLVLSYAALRGSGVRPWGHDRRLLVLRGVVGFIALSGFYYAVVHLPLADATVIQYTNPVYAALLAVPLLGERLEPRVAAAILASLAGVALIAEPAFLFGGGAAGGLDPTAVAAGLLGAVGSGTAYVTVRKLKATEHPMVIVFYFALVSTLASLPLALPAALWPTPVEWLVLLGVGLTTQLGQVAITRGLHLESAGRATTVGYLQIVFAALWGALFFSELPDAGTLLGAALIVLGTLALVRRPRRTA